MAEIRKAAGGTPTYTITHEDGSAVTPQEVYDAFMSGPVILESQFDGGGGGMAQTVIAIQYAGVPGSITSCKIMTKDSEITLGGA